MTEPGWRRLVMQAGRLLHSWWRGDSIRISPTEGRLLRLRPPCCLLIHGQPVEVLWRTVQPGPGGTLVSYRCRTGGDLGLLTIELQGKCQGAVARWQVRGQMESVSISDIEVFQTIR